MASFKISKMAAGKIQNGQHVSKMASLTNHNFQNGRNVSKMAAFSHNFPNGHDKTYKSFEFAKKI